MTLTYEFYGYYSVHNRATAVVCSKCYTRGRGSLWEGKVRCRRGTDGGAQHSCNALLFPDHSRWPIGHTALSLDSRHNLKILSTALQEAYTRRSRCTWDLKLLCYHYMLRREVQWEQRWRSGRWFFCFEPGSLEKVWWVELWLQRCLVLEPRTCGHVTLHTERYFSDEIELRISRQEDYPWLIQPDQYYQKTSYPRKAGGWVWEGDMMEEGEIGVMNVNQRMWVTVRRWCREVRDFLFLVCKAHNRHPYTKSKESKRRT